MTSDITEKLTAALKFEITEIPYKNFPMVILEYDENNKSTERSKLLNEYLQHGVSLARLAPLHLALVELVSAIDALTTTRSFGQEYEKCEQALARLAEVLK